jgi:hypothetical protein
MSQVFDVLYGNNLGSGASSDIFALSSQLLQYEQELAVWQRTLPKSIAVVAQEDINFEPTKFITMRLRVILTLRFLNLRILTHRPLLCKYLETIGTRPVDMLQLATLRQVGARSIQVCAQSALLIIRMTSWALKHQTASQQLLGAWWFTLYYGVLD